MSSLKEIRRKIRSVDHIKQITQSMEMVAAARMQKALLKLMISKRILIEMEQMMNALLCSAKTLSHPLLIPGKKEDIALIIMSADRGLCGAYNNTIFQRVDKILTEHGKEKVHLFLFGRKAIEYYKNKKDLIINEQEKTEEIIEGFIARKWSTVQAVYTKYQTTFLRSLLHETVLPIKKAENITCKSDYIIEPSKEEALSILLPRYASLVIQNMRSEAYASELAARVCAMRSATKNAEEILDTLTIEKNKMRQASITREILEIATSAEWMK